jgi:hypothetical protein
VAAMDLHAVDEHDHLTQRLLALRALDFRFATNHDSAGMIVALVGIRAHHEVIDIIRLYGATDADAIRVPIDEPDVLFPRKTIWRTAGSADDVIDTVLDLANQERNAGQPGPAE